MDAFNHLPCCKNHIAGQIHAAIHSWSPTWTRTPVLPTQFSFPLSVFFPISDFCISWLLPPLSHYTSLFMENFQDFRWHDFLIPVIMCYLLFVISSYYSRMVSFLWSMENFSTSSQITFIHSFNKYWIKISYACYGLNYFLQKKKKRYIEFLTSRTSVLADISS